VIVSDAASLAAKRARFKHTFEEVVDVLPSRHYCVEQAFVEHTFRRKL
jgi:hypothetical protein